MFHVTEMLARENDYDDEFMRPNEYVISTASTLLLEAERCTPEAMLIHNVSMIGDGGLHIYFHANGRDVIVNLLPTCNDTSYIYHGNHDDFGADYEVIPEKLVYWLKWMMP